MSGSVTDLPGLPVLHDELIEGVAEQLVSVLDHLAAPSVHRGVDQDVRAGRRQHVGAGGGVLRAACAPRGGLVVLDAHGTDHDPAHWPDPDRFDPDRFLQGSVDLDALVPQGGGDVATGYRCPGEVVTLTMLAVAARVLARTPYTLPAQDLG
jgi:hypothetical protein